MNRALLKQDAKDAMHMANPHPAIVTLVFLAVSLAGSMILTAISTIFGLADAVMNNSSFSFIGALFYLALSVAFALVIGVIEFGYSAYCLKVFKHEDTGVNELFSYFPLIFKVLGLSLWMSLFVMLWSLLFYIPGIIAALRYSQSFYILIENPDKSIRECVNESKELMSGRLWEYFVLQLSFILWLLLTTVTCGIAGLYVQPYMEITNAGYYLSLKPPVFDSGYSEGYQDGYQNGYQDGYSNGGYTSAN